MFSAWQRGIGSSDTEKQKHFKTMDNIIDNVGLVLVLIFHLNIREIVSF